jgi:hypothetical protein
MKWKGELSLIDKSQLSDKEASVDLVVFSELVTQKIEHLPIFKKYNYSMISTNNKMLKMFSWEERSETICELILRNMLREVKVSLFPKNGGHLLVKLRRLDYGENGIDKFVVSRYFELNDNNGDDRSCFALINFIGSIEDKVEKSLSCINRVFEKHFETILSGEEWIDVPPSHYDYR